MSASLRALLTGAIDYAGMFPPAKLPLEEAFRNYLVYRECPDAWMLGRFICPAGRLEELVQLILNAPLESPIYVSCIGSGGSTFEELFKNSNEDLEGIRAFGNQSAERAMVDVLETKLPDEPFKEKKKVLRDKVQEVSQLFAKENAKLESVFFEIAKPDFGSNKRWFIEQLAKIDSRIGIKLRCGGPKPEDFPSPIEVGMTIVSCAISKTRLKFTAGLHHPIHHLDALLGTPAHGFINVMASTVFSTWPALETIHDKQKEPAEIRSAFVDSLNPFKLSPVLESENPCSFTFDDSGLTWRDFEATTEQIAAARKNLALSFGSCSFDEPRDDLRKLGWLL
jgi:hypothetical protein